MHFDLSSVHFRETILQAELHLELRPLSVSVMSEGSAGDRAHYPVGASSINSIDDNNNKNNGASAVPSSFFSNNEEPADDAAADHGGHLFIHVYLIEGLFPFRRRLIGKKSLPSTSSSSSYGDMWPSTNNNSPMNLTEVVTIRPAVVEWINRPHHNFGK